MSKTVWPSDWKVEWPARKCREAIWKGDIPHLCELYDLHDGPCASPAVEASIQRRNTWIREEGENA